MFAPAQPSSSSPAWPLAGARALQRESPGPLPSPEAGVSFRPSSPAPTPRPRVQELPATGRGRGAGRMSPHGKPAGGQAQGQPRPPASTLRAPDRGACAPRPLAPGSSAGGRRRGPWAPPTHLTIVKPQKTPGAAPPLSSAPLGAGLPAASPPAAELHNRGGDACPAAAGAGRFTWPGLGPQRRGPRGPVRGCETGTRDAVCPPGRPALRLPGTRRRRVRCARSSGPGNRSPHTPRGAPARGPALCPWQRNGGHQTQILPPNLQEPLGRGQIGQRGERQPRKIISGPLAGREKNDKVFFLFAVLWFCFIILFHTN